MTFHQLLKKGREEKQLKTRELAKILSIDQALISKFENGLRRPTREQIGRLATVLEIPYDTLLVAWLKDKVLKEVGIETLSLKVLKEVEITIKESLQAQRIHFETHGQNILHSIDSLREKFSKYPIEKRQKVHQLLLLENVFVTLKAHGSDLTLQNVHHIVLEGKTIDNKSMLQHMEATNLTDAFHYVYMMAERNFILTEKEIQTIHQMILKGLRLDNPNIYRQYPLNPEEDTGEIPKLIVDWIKKCDSSHSSIHPLLTIIDQTEHFLTLQPFKEGNLRMGQILFQWMLTRANYPFVPYAIQRPISGQTTDYTSPLTSMERTLKSLIEWMDKN